MSDQEHSTDPVVSAAKSLLALDDTTEKPDQRTIENTLQLGAMRIAENNLGGMEAILSHQTQILHRIFTQAVDKYAGSATPEQCKLYGDIALKAQSYCRRSMIAITALKQSEERTDRLDKARTQKLADELQRKAL